MKMLLLMSLTAAIFALTDAQAQSDSTKTVGKTQIGTSSAKETNPFVGMSPVKATELPAAVRTRLQEPAYKGWENSSLYKNSTSDRFGFQLGQGESSRTYIFSHEGIPVKNIP